MGHLSSQEALALRWAELCADPLLRDLPYKIELNAWGKIEMSPTSTRHARVQGAVTAALSNSLPKGAVLTECPIATDIGVRVPDVAWGSNAFFARHGDATPLPQAPEICVEVRSLSNADEEMEAKRKAYLAAGAVEVWIVSEAGSVDIFDATGRCEASRFGVRLTLPAPAATNG